MNEASYFKYTDNKLHDDYEKSTEVYKIRKQILTSPSLQSFQDREIMNSKIGSP